VDKPAGPTSHDVVARVRRALGIRAAGHTGTLDPFATGLLVVLLGRATRLARFLEDRDKTYRATARLGVTTDTEDASGSETGRVEPDAWPDEIAVRETMAAMTGPQQQVPPAFSAKRVAGRRSYQLARAGRPVTLAAVPVTVSRFECLNWRPPLLEFRAVVSAGTYIRSLARDLGERLGLGAHLVALRREAIGPLGVDRALPLDAVGPGVPLVPAGELLGHLPRVALDETQRAAVAHGRLVRAEGAKGLARLMAGDELVAVAEGREAGWQPVVVLADG